MRIIKIPFNKPYLVGNELEYINEVIKIGHAAGDGAYTQKCQRLLQTILKVPKVLLTTSCTHALEMAALLLDIQPGDEVIVPSFTFVSTVNAFLLRGAKPIFIDIRKDTLNLDETLLDKLITNHTKAIVVVHYAGVGCEMETILKIANKHNLPVIEDNAHGLLGRYKGKYLGTFGSLATQSFHETKNFICGEGGALLINHSKFIERAEILREKGTDRNRFFRGQVDKYSWVDLGSSYLPSDILAAFLYAQLEMRDKIQSMRKQIWSFYFKHLTNWANDNDVKLPTIPSSCEQPFHMFYLLMPSLKSRQDLIKHLASEGILSVFHYVPLHSSPMGMKLGYQPNDLPITEQISSRLVRLPFYNGLSQEQLKLITGKVKEITVKKLVVRSS